MPDPNLLGHVALPDDLRDPPHGAIADPPRRILLTGATGYLGAYLLAALLARSDATIVCLVRAATAAAGLARLKENLARYELDGDLARVEVIIGSVDQPRLGLDQETWMTLAAEIDVIVDAAASVNFIRPLDHLLPTNVGGPINLLRLAAEVRPKALHLSSSYSVFNASAYDDAAFVGEDPLIGDGAGFRGGYPASKWIAERIGDLARARGWNVTIHRLGYLWGDTRTGRSKADDPVTLNVRACIAMGMAQDINFLMHITPVDFSAAAMAQIAVAPMKANRHYHTVTETPISWPGLVQGICDNGHAIEMVPFSTWQKGLLGLLGAHREFTSLAMASLIDPERTVSANVYRMQFDASRLRAALAPSGVACPPLDTRLIRTYLDAMLRPDASGAAARER